MDAIKFMKEKRRMCKSYPRCTDACLLRKPMYENGITCLGYCFEYPEKAVAIVEKWSAEHPVNTRRSEFLKMFPNVKVSNGVISICPKHIDSECGADCKEDCTNCRKNYWFAEV